MKSCVFNTLEIVIVDFIFSTKESLNPTTSYTLLENVNWCPRGTG